MKTISKKLSECSARTMKVKKKITKSCKAIATFASLGCIPAEEMKFVLSTICSEKEAQEMLDVVDRNGDGVISYSEFRCMMGANPILL